MGWWRESRKTVDAVRDDALRFHEFRNVFVMIDVVTAAKLGYLHPYAELTSC